MICGKIKVEVQCTASVINEPRPITLVLLRPLLFSISQNLSQIVSLYTVVKKIITNTLSYRTKLDIALGNYIIHFISNLQIICLIFKTNHTVGF